MLWTLRGKRLGVLGLAFKGGTDDIRESPAILLLQELLRTAHSLKSSSAALGALQLSSRCATIELLARENGLEPVTPHLLPLDADLAAATEGLQIFMETADVAA